MLPVSTKQGRAYTLHELTKSPFRSEDAVVIGIGMSFLDVHVNRAPIAGRVALHRHFPGRFGSLKRPEMAFENERATTIIEQDDLQVAVVQIASRLVRQIASFVHEGQQVALGQRIGVIRLGSQVDLVLPAHRDVQVTVRPGERVRAGESILALVARPAVGAAGSCQEDASWLTTQR
jgi:phosphatidylserine decarboxylase